MKEAIPQATAARLPLYVRGLNELCQGGVELVSSRTLAEVTGLESHQIRKDLSFLGSFGKRGVGYQADELLKVISDHLRLSRTWRVALIGCGRLGTALAMHLSVSGRNFRLCAVFDCSTRKIGTKLGGLEILPWQKIPSVIKEMSADMAMIATPPLAAQGVADLVVKSGVRLILNFAPTQLIVPETVVVRRVDLADELQALTMQIPSHRPPKAKHAVRPTISWIAQ